MACYHTYNNSMYIFAYKCIDSSRKDEQTGKTMVVSRKNKVTRGQRREGDFHAISFCSFIIVPCDYYLIKNTFKVDFLKWCQSEDNLKVLWRKWQRWSWRLESGPRSHEESKPHNCVRQARTCYLYVGSCRQAKVKDWFLQPIREAWQQHINKEVDKTVPSVLQTLCWPSWAITKVQMEARGWKILRKANSDSWKGRQAFHHGQGRWRIKWSDSSDAHFHYGSPRHSGIRGKVSAMESQQHKTLTSRASFTREWICPLQGHLNM